MFYRGNVFGANKYFSQELESSVEVCTAKRKFLDNLGHTIVELDTILYYTKLGIRVASGASE